MLPSALGDASYPYGFGCNLSFLPPSSSLSSCRAHVQDLNARDFSLHVTNGIQYHLISEPTIPRNFFEVLPLTAQNRWPSRPRRKDHSLGVHSMMTLLCLTSWLPKLVIFSSPKCNKLTTNLNARSDAAGGQTECQGRGANTLHES